MSSSRLTIYPFASSKMHPYHYNVKIEACGHGGCARSAGCGALWPPKTVRELICCTKCPLGECRYDQGHTFRWPDERKERAKQVKVLV